MAYADGNVWTFHAGRFTVRLNITPDYGYQYDGDDEDGETQARLDSGAYVAFDSDVTVHDLSGVIIGRASLGGSVYGYDEVSAFWTAHRDSDAMNRNCTLMRAAWRGQGDTDAKVSICHYFPDMVAQAVAEARAYLIDAKRAYVRQPKGA